KERVFVAFVGLDGEVERVVALGAGGVEFDAGGQTRGALCGDARDGGFGRDDNFKGARGPLRARGRAGVVNEVALRDAELIGGAFEREDVGLGRDAFDFRGYVVDGDVAGGVALRRADEVSRSLG